MKSAASLTDKELSFQSVIDALTSQIAILDDKGVIIATNQAWRSFKSDNRSALANSDVGENYLKKCEKIAYNGLKAAKDVVEAIIKIQQGEKNETYVEYPCLSGENQYWYQVKISPFAMEQGKTIVIHQNVTDKKNAENRVIDSERLFRSIIEQASEGVVIIDQSGKIIEWNQAEERITGRLRESVIGRYMWDVQFESFSGTPPPKMKAAMKGMISGLLQNGASSWAGKSNEVEIVRPDGTKVTIENIIFPIVHDHGYYACSLTRDTTELKSMGSARKALAEKLANYVDYSPIIALIVTIEGKFVDVNPEAQKRLGYKKTELLNMTMPDLIFKEDLDYAVSLFKRLVSKGHYSAEFRVKTKNNKKLALSANAVVLPDGNLMILCNDITDLKESQKKLQQNESFLNSILDNIPSAITVKEVKNFTFFKVNRMMENFLGKTNNELKGKTIYEFFSKEEADFLAEQDRLAFFENRIIDIPVLSTTAKNNEGRLFHQKKIPMYDNDGKPSFLLTISNDITEQIELRDQANARLTRLEAISKLSTRLQTIPSLDEMMPVLLNMLMPIVSAEMGCIWLYKSEREVLIPVFHKGGGREYESIIGGPQKTDNGIIGKVFTSQRPYFCEDYAGAPLVSENKKRFLTKKLGGVSLPLQTANSIIGVINLSSTKNESFSEEDLKLLTTLSEIAGNAIQNLSLKEQTEQRLTRLSALSSIDRAISSSFDIQVSLEILVSNVITQLQMDAASVLLFNPFSKLLEYKTGQGFHTNAIESTSLRLGEHLAGKAAVSRELVQVKNLKEYSDRFVTPKLENEKFVTYYGVPLIAKGQLKGVLEVFNRTEHEPDNDWLNYLKALAEQATIAIDNMQMFEDLHRSNIELSMAYNATIEGWSKALDLRDKETEGHTLRVTEMTERLAKAFNFPDSQLKYIRWGALLHDIGKLGVPDGILLKPGSLTDEEWTIMKLHPQYAFEMLAPIGYLRQAIDIPYCHHEKWDGTGYPRGLKGEMIPLAARIFAVVDIWDALHSDRPYRKAWPMEKIIEHLHSISGTHLDPSVVDFCLKTGIFTENRD